MFLMCVRFSPIFSHQGMVMLYNDIVESCCDCVAGKLISNHNPPPSGGVSQDPKLNLSLNWT